MTFEKKSITILAEALEKLEEGFNTLPAFEPQVDRDTLRSLMLKVAERMQDNYPYHHPFYLGQMLKPPHPVARLAYMLAMWINPNNHALDGGRASSAMEKEAVADIAKMFGWETHLGHLTGGGTMANLEGLWIAGKLNPGKKVVASTQAHYTHARISDVLQIPFEAVQCDHRAKMDMQTLETLLQQGDVGTVIATIGTTAAGSVDPLPEIFELQSRYGFRVHADAAYGGYYVLVDNLRSDTRSIYDCLDRVDSIAIDPHKHGLQPYGCGCILFRDPSVGVHYKHDSPYTYFSSDDLHLGEISLECSRAGASAVALWATHHMYPPVREGDFAQTLNNTREAALTLYEKIKKDPRFMTIIEPELDILIWAPKAKNASTISKLSKNFFETAARENLHLAIADFPRSLLEPAWPEVTWDQDTATCLRSCLMKPEHLEWMDRIWVLIDRIAQNIT
jgi:glutamate/tyrosine decarboxylase-like PLP-dependent enzyme